MNNNTLLWEVSGNDLAHPAYVYGTMHLLCASDAVLSSALKSVIDRSDEIYFEIDLDDPGQMLEGFSSGKMSGDTSLKDLYSEEEYQRIKEFFASRHLSAQFMFFDHMQPMLVSALVYQSVLPCQVTDGMEMSIMEYAHSLKKDINGLETAAFQASIINKIPYSEQAKELLNSIDSISGEKTEAKQMVDLYKTQNLDSLLQYSLESEGGTTEEMQELMIFQRNRTWANMVPQIAKDKKILIAVGAAHLGGEKGLLNLLRQKGYILRPISNE